MSWKLFLNSLKIWVGALIINSFLIFIYATATENIGAGILVSVFCFIGGAFVTAPLLVIVYHLLKISFRIPYGLQAQLAWFGFTLATIVVALFIGVALWTRIWWEEKDFQLFPVGIFLSIIISVSISFGSLRKLRKSIYEHSIA